jgi:hypothetical protein
VLPTLLEHDHIILYQYDDILNEYDSNELDQIYAFSNCFPSISLCIELFRSKKEFACKSATTLSVKLLSEFKGVVNDLSENSQFWELKDIINATQKEGQKFLDCYRKNFN